MINEKNRKTSLNLYSVFNREEVFLKQFLSQRIRNKISSKQTKSFLKDLCFSLRN